MIQYIDDDDDDDDVQGCYGLKYFPTHPAF